MPHVDEGTLHAYLDGELPPAERHAVEMHLAECAVCRATLAEEQALLERASALLGAARPADRPAPPFEQLGLPRSRKRSPWHVRMPVAWAASIALALGVGYYLRGPALAPSSVAIEQRRDEATGPLGYAEPSEKNEPARALARVQRQTPAPTTPSTRRPTEEAPRAVARADGPSLDSARFLSDEKAEGETGRLNRAATLPQVGALTLTPPPAAPQLRNAAPAPAAQAKAKEPLALEAIVVSGAAVSGLFDLRGRATTTSWAIISKGAARSLLGTDPVGLPGLDRQIRRSPGADGTVVVEQKIDSATTIQIFQRQNGMDSSGLAWYYRAAPSDTVFARQREREIAGADRLARYVGRLRVEIAGPLSTDSLNKLLDQVQPLP